MMNMISLLNRNAESHFITSKKQKLILTSITLSKFWNKIYILRQ